MATAFAGIIHDHHHFEGHEAPKETDHHHEIEHKHATSHQSFKFHHYHAVPTYIKKEDQEFVKHPVEVSGVKHNLKIVHPETEHHHGHGLTLENHQEVEDKTLGHHEHKDYHGYKHDEGLEHHDFGDHHHKYHHEE